MTNADRPEPVTPSGAARSAPGPSTADRARSGPATDNTDGPGGSAGDRGREVAGHARSEAEQVAETASDRAGDVMDTTQDEIHDVVDEVRSAVRQQADRQAEVAADALSRVRDDLQAMSGGDAPRSSTAEYLQKAAGSVDQLVGRLERDGIEGALSGTRRFAQRNPGGFLLASAGAGFAIGRILRNADHPQQVDEDRPSGSQTDAGDTEIDLTREQPTTASAARARDVAGRQAVR